MVLCSLLLVTSLHTLPSRSGEEDVSDWFREAQDASEDVFNKDGDDTKQQNTAKIFSLCWILSVYHIL